MKRILLLALAGVTLTIASQAEPLTFTITAGAENSIRFESKAPMETIIGTTDQISGSITLDPANLTAGVSATLVVDPAAIKTGNGIRDSHMRENHLHTKQHPEIKFTMADLPLEGALGSGEARPFTIEGEFTLHGVTKKINLPVEVTLFALGEVQRLHITGHFEVRLADYSIPRPQFLVMKLDEVQSITLDFWGVAK